MQGKNHIQSRADHGERGRKREREEILQISYELNKSSKKAIDLFGNPRKHVS